MLETIWAQIGVPLAIFGLIFGVVQSIRLELKLRKFQPLISKAFSLMGTLGKKTQVDSAEFAEVEEALKGASMDMISQQYPEVALIMGWLEQNQPDTFQKVMDKPELLIALYQKWAPKLMGLIGKRAGNREKRQMYDI